MIASTIMEAWSLGVGVVGSWAGLRTRGKVAIASFAHPSALLLRPCAGAEARLEETLTSSRVASPHVRVRFLIADAADGAASAAARATAALATEGRDARVVVTRAPGPNRKASQLARAVEFEPDRTDVVIVADSDVALTTQAIEALLAPIATGEADATWAPPVETSPSTPADHASAAVLDASLHSFRLLAALDPHGMVGKLLAVRRDALDAVGGFSALVGHLGEDMELARLLRTRGMRVRSSSVCATSLAAGRSWGEVVARYARWLTVIRAQRASLLVTYPVLLAATPLLLVVGVAALWFEGAAAVPAICLALVVRFGIGALARRRAGRPVRGLRALSDGLLADTILLVAFSRALAGCAVVWRGTRLKLASEGMREPGR